MSSHSSVRHRITSAKRIVIKVGSRLLVNEKNEPSYERIHQLVAEIAQFKNQGIQVILVSSGAIAAGMSVLGMTQRPKEVPDLQAAAAAGQSRLMAYYEQACREFGFHAGQLLVTSDDLKQRRRHLNFLHCANALLKRNVLPIINENDSISVEEICFGDNDQLAALVGVMTKSDLTVLLTSTDGMYLRDQNGQLGERISIIEEINDEIKAMAEGTDGNELSTGGMISKLYAAERVTTCGEDMWIIDGNNFNNLSHLRQGEDIGTYLPAQQNNLNSNKRWLAFFGESKGQIFIDKGAEQALIKHGKSLLPKGLISLEGQIKKGDIVDIINEEQELIARGSCNYSSLDLQKVLGRNTDELYAIIGHDYYKTIVHRDNMAILSNS